jgi:hypothetical protein
MAGTGCRPSIVLFGDSITELGAAAGGGGAGWAVRLAERWGRRADVLNRGCACCARDHKTRPGKKSPPHPPGTATTSRTIRPAPLSSTAWWWGSAACALPRAQTPATTPAGRCSASMSPSERLSRLRVAKAVGVGVTRRSSRFSSVQMTPHFGNTTRGSTCL